MADRVGEAASPALWFGFRLMVDDVVRDQVREVDRSTGPTLVEPPHDVAVRRRTRHGTSRRVALAFRRLVRRRLLHPCWSRDMTLVRSKVRARSASASLLGIETRPEVTVGTEPARTGLPQARRGLVAQPG